MSRKLTFGFALRNMKANKYLEIPFLLSTGIMLILFNIMVSLSSNSYVHTRHQLLPTIVMFGGVVAGIFTLVFVLYANRFLIRRRNKEFALYGILGLEKRHIRRILFVEHCLNYGMILFISTIGGFFFGKLAFLGVNRMLKDTTGSLMNYPFSVNAFVITTIFVVILFVIVYFLNIFAIKNASPVELLGKDKKGEGEPKNRLILLVIGLLFLVSGYGIALVVEGVLKSLAYFFLAAILVIFATYLLFVSLSIAILKLQKKKRGFYYKSKHFLTISGMLYRMKSGAIGLASLSILSAGVIITLATTLTIYSNIEETLRSTMVREYELSSYRNYPSGEVKVAKEKLNCALDKVIGKEAKKSFIKEIVMVPVVIEENQFLPITEEKIKSSAGMGAGIFLMFSTLDAYNKEFDKNLTLNKGEVLLSSYDKSLLKNDTFIFAGETYHGKEVENLVPGNIAIETVGIVLPDEESLFRMADYYKVLTVKNGKWGSAPVKISIWFDSDEENIVERWREHEEEEEFRHFYVTSRDEKRIDMYELNGGFLFLGIVVGIIFLSGTVLITYYKQVSEGIEDREKYAIMKKVGLSDRLIRKTANVQVIWMFFLPLLVAVLHCFVASKIVFQLLGLFGVHDYKSFAYHFLSVTGLFAIVYFMNFKITSYIYYKHVQ